jgi:Fe2+ transport system protein FeoA
LAQKWSFPSRPECLKFYGYTGKVNDHKLFAASVTGAGSFAPTADPLVHSAVAKQDWLRTILIVPPRQNGATLLSWWKSRTRPIAAAPPARPACPLADCGSGCRAAVLLIECGENEARRLRNLGLFEGSCVTVVDRQAGFLLDVAGSRLAVGPALASEITVLPLEG